MNIGSLVATLKADTTQFKKGLSEAKSEVGSFATKATAGLKGVQKGAVVVTGAIVGVGLGLYKIAEDASNLVKVEDTFNKLTDSVGINADALKEDLRVETRGLVDDQALLMNSNKLLAMGIAENSDEVIKNTDLAIRLGAAMGMEAQPAMENWNLMMANQSIPRLDSYGISSSKVRVRIKELMEETKGMTREQAFNIAVMEEAEGHAETLGIQELSLTEKKQQLIVTIKNASTEIGKELIPAFEALADALIPLVKEYLPKIIDFVKKAVTWFKNLSPTTQKLIGIAIVLAPVLAAASTVLLGILAILPAISAGVTILGGVLAFLVSPVGLVIAAIVALITIGILLYKNWDKIKEMATKTWGAIKDEVGKAWNALVEKVDSFNTKIKDAIMRPFIEAKEKIGEAVDWIKDKLDWTKRSSPSVIDVVENSVGLANKAYAGFGVGVRPTGTTNLASARDLGAGSFVINMAGAHISGPEVAEEYAELIGDTIIKRFNRAKRAA